VVTNRLILRLLLPKRVSEDFVFRDGATWILAVFFPENSQHFIGLLLFSGRHVDQRLVQVFPFQVNGPPALPHTRRTCLHTPSTLREIFFQYASNQSDGTDLLQLCLDLNVGKDRRPENQSEQKQADGIDDFCHTDS